MKKHLPFLCLCLLAALPQTLQAAERVQFQFDDRKWVVGFERSTGAAVSAGYVLEGESQEKWTEMLSSEVAENLPRRTPPAKLVETIQAGMRRVVTGKLVWNVLSTSPTEVMYEWTLTKDHLRPDEQEIVRVIKGEAGIHVVHYATRKVPMSDVARQQWISLLRAARLLKK